MSHSLKTITKAGIAGIFAARINAKAAGRKADDPWTYDDYQEASQMRDAYLKAASVVELYPDALAVISLVDEMIDQMDRDAGGQAEEPEASSSFDATPPTSSPFTSSSFTSSSFGTPANETKEAEELAAFIAALAPTDIAILLAAL